MRLRVTLIISLLMHVGILLAAVFGLPSPEEYQIVPQEALPVEIVNIEEVSRRVAMAKQAPEPEKPAEKPAPAKPEEVSPPEPAPKAAREPVRPEPEPEPEPEPAPEKKAELPPEPEPEPAPDPAKLKKLVETIAKPEPAPRRPAPPRPRARPRKIRRLAALEREKRRKKKPADPIDDIAALLNKVDDERRAPPPEARETGAPLKGPADMSGTDARLSADLVDALRQKIESCWNIPAGVRDAEGLRVRLRFQMGRNGEVTGGPEVLNALAHPAFRAAAASAVRAVLACQPYDFLPVEKYEAWKDVILNFDPGRMLAVN